MVLGYSRLNCVVPVFRQDLVTVIDCFEQAFEFFGGCPRRVVIDGMKACLDKADPCTPRFNRTFLEYANYRGFLPDAARPRHPKECVPRRQLARDECLHPHSMVDFQWPGRVVRCIRS
jgi:transposase